MCERVCGLDGILLAYGALGNVQPEGGLLEWDAGGGQVLKAHGMMYCDCRIKCLIVY